VVTSSSQSTQLSHVRESSSGENGNKGDAFPKLVYEDLEVHVQAEELCQDEVELLCMRKAEGVESICIYIYTSQFVTKNHHTHYGPSTVRVTISSSIIRLVNLITPLDLSLFLELRKNPIKDASKPYAPLREQLLDDPLLLDRSGIFSSIQFKIL